MSKFINSTSFLRKIKVVILRKKLNLIFFHVAETDFGMTAESSTMFNAFMVTSKNARISLVLLVCTLAIFSAISGIWELKTLDAFQKSHHA